MSVARHPFTFPCDGETLVGIVTVPPQPSGRGVLIVVGGPQYRVGSHRQFVLLADHLGAHGTAVMRFDCRGMGDSSGGLRGFEHFASDLRAAVDAFFGRVQALREVVLWGLCDGASAALLYAPHDARVCGLVLANPWVHTAQGAAITRLKHYYWRRLWSADAWRRLMGGRMDVHGSIASLAQDMREAVAAPGQGRAAADAPARGASEGEPLDGRMADALARFAGPVMLVLAGQDLTAREFDEKSSASRRWRRLLAAPRITRRELPEATHTFPRRDWRDQVAGWTASWMRTW